MLQLPGRRLTAKHENHCFCFDGHESYMFSMKPSLNFQVVSSFFAALSVSSAGGKRCVTVFLHVLILESVHREHLILIFQDKNHILELL